MGRFREHLAEQRWDDHRYYHHSVVNQALHFVSASTFVVAYILVWSYPWLAALLAWGVSMTSRQAGHFFFEPKGYDHVNDASHEYKEEIKVGYNLFRKVVLMSLWAATPIALLIEPTLFGVFPAHQSATQYFEHLGLVWLALGVGALLFRTVQLFFIRDVETGLVWATKILTDPFHDMKLYAKAPLQLLRSALAWRPARG
ncbi:MAG: hypothetical protein B7Z33_06955 [Sphingomonadales bacterium 12-68-11]|nr:MAG: hypothetical protein B7Z33_06955 [Sphingomonadales bacterium 12-68-11]